MELTFDQADSEEEVYFSWWLEEVIEAGYVAACGYQAVKYDLSPSQLYDVDTQLKTKIRTDKKTLLQPHTYTPDFSIVWNVAARGLFYYSISDRKGLSKTPLTANSEDHYDTSVIDIKPPAFRHGASFMALFKVNQKWVYEKYGVYVQPVVLVGSKNKNKRVTTGLFPTTFTPERYLLTDKEKKKRILHYEPRSLKDFVMDNKNSDLTIGS